MAVDPLLRARAQAAIKADKASVSKLSGENRYALIEELHMHQVELEMQNEELRASQQKLQAARDSYAELYDLAPVAYLTLAGDDTIKQANLTAAALFGKTRAKLVDARWSRFIHHDDQDVWHLFRTQLLDQASQHECELRVTAPNGVRIVQVATHPIPEPGGTAPTLLVSLTDVTGRRLAEQKLQAREQQFQSLLASLDEVVWSATPDGTFLYLNRATERVYGLPLDDCLAERDFWLKAVVPEDRDIAERAAFQLSELGSASCEYRIQRPDGSIRWLNDRKYLVRDGDKVVGLAGVATDVSERKQAEAESLAARQELAIRLQHEKENVEAELAKSRGSLVLSTRLATIGRVAAQMAHELRNPLGSVRNAAFLIRLELPADRHELLSMLQLMDDELATADIIIRNLLSATQPPDSNPQLLDVTSQVTQAFARLRARGQVTLLLDSPSDPLRVPFDPLQFRQLLDNLLSNACEAVDDSGQVTVQVCKIDDAVELRVIDSGSGIPLELRNSVFEPFFTTKLQGTGLGLAICRQIIEQHGGTICVEDSHRSGTSIKATIPLSISERRLGVRP